jgi:hypothetical protein
MEGSQLGSPPYFFIKNGIEPLTRGARGGEAPSHRAAKRRKPLPGVTGPQGPPRGGSAPYGERSDRSWVRAPLDPPPKTRGGQIGFLS